MKLWKIAGITVLALGLVLGLALPALAASDWTQSQANYMPPKLLRGEVVSTDEGKTFFVIQSQGQEVTILVNSDTRYIKAPIPRRFVSCAKRLIGPTKQSQESSKLTQRLRPWEGRKAGLLFRASAPREVPTLARHQLEMRDQYCERLELARNWLRTFTEEANFDDITLGTRLVVRVEPAEDSLVAKLVIISDPTTYHRVSGTVADISPEDRAITISPTSGGGDVIINYNESTRFVLHGTPELEEGQSVCAVYNDDMIANILFSW